MKTSILSFAAVVVMFGAAESVQAQTFFDGLMKRTVEEQDTRAPRRAKNAWTGAEREVLESGGVSHRRQHSPWYPPSRVIARDDGITRSTDGSFDWRRPAEPPSEPRMAGTYQRDQSAQ